MERIWFQSYEQKVPMTIDPDQYPSLIAMFNEYCKKYANKNAFKNFNVTLSFAELEQLSRNFAAYLQNELGLKKGERFAIMLPNLLQYPIALFGALRAGLTVVNINPLYTERELQHPLQDANVSAILTLENFASVLERVLPRTSVKHVMITKIGDFFPGFKKFLFNFVIRYIHRAIPKWNIADAISFESAVQKGETLPFSPAFIQSEDIAFIQYTGGTTGKVKGAILTHRNMVANILQCTAWIGDVLKKGEEIIVTALPLYHIFSLTICCLTFLQLGGTSLLVTNPRKLSSLIRLLKSEPFTVFVGVNTLYHGLLGHPDFSQINFSAMKLSLAGGMAVTQKVAEKWQEATGKCIVMGYGLTEASPVVTIQPLHTSSFSPSLGLPVSSTDIKICDDQNREVPMGRSGELQVKGPQVMKGYWNNESETQLVLDEQGWLRTGDIVRIDTKGFLYLEDRKKDMILVSGFNVYPNEIEEIISSHPDVLEAAVVGVPDQSSGEAVKAFVVKKNPELTEQEILLYCKKYLTGYKLPKFVEFKTDLPKSHIGKVLRRDLREVKQ